MLETLHIRNIALIEDETIELYPGFSVLTGETGAGKSIIIGALNFALGERVSGKELIRTGAEKASVEAVFGIESNDSVSKLLEINEIEPEDNALILTRDLSVTGRSVCRVNGCVVSLSVLKQFGDLLVDIHGQHEHQSLLDSRSHRPMLDRFGARVIEPLLLRISDCYAKAREAETALKKLDANVREREHKLDLYRHQMNEIDAARFTPDEEDSLIQRKKVLVNAQKISDALAAAKDALTGDEGVSEKMMTAKRSLASIADIGKDYETVSDSVNDAYYALEDIADSVRTLLDTSVFDENELDEVEQRLELIHALERKYGTTITEILSYRASIGVEYDSLENAEQSREALAKDYDTQLKMYKEAASDLSVARHDAAKTLKQELLMELSGLGMPHASFDVSFTPLEGDLPSETGTEQIEFLLSANKGENPKPLAKVASGGEISRIMLAFKRVLADSDKIPTMVFDEIDTGISGMIGNAVARKMQQIACDRQVICITHLPQIAAAAERQYHVFKTETDNKTVSGVRLLDATERPAEIARIMGSNPSDTVALEHAARLMNQIQ